VDRVLDRTSLAECLDRRAKKLAKRLAKPKKERDARKAKWVQA